MKEFSYDKSFYNKKDLKYFAKLYLKFLPEDVTGLVSMGSSGCSIASAMLVLHKKRLDHFHIRKEEMSHSTYTSIPSNKNHVLAIVDDFISTGKTILKITERLKKILERKPKIITKYVLVLNCPGGLKNMNSEFKTLYDNGVEIILIEEKIECHS